MLSQRASRARTLRLRIALVQNDIESLQTKLMDIVTMVNEWLYVNGLKATNVSPFGDWICFNDTTVSRASELFHAGFSTFVHDRSGQNPIHILEYSILASLKDYLELVHPTITVGLASGVPTVFISVGDQFHDGGLEGFLDIVDFLNDKSAHPQILTTSHGQDENSILRALAYRLCNTYTSLSARGVTTLFSSGDGDVSGLQNTEYTTFIPTFPSGCPIVTSVGGTESFNPETSASFLLSGGFSNYFDTPSAIQHLRPGLPDVSAAGTNLQIVLSSIEGSVEGMSCSSPIFASVVSLLNDRLIVAGKPALGFLNPLLYSIGASALDDITIGCNPRCNTNGFPGTVG
ncbi:peptidase S8/S53 domain-containing protein [Lactarius indigo]|nr:peptidase S8/S53 domain-containing protein [Lactarius indigo]